MIDTRIVLSRTFVREIVWRQQTASTSSDALAQAAAAKTLPLLIGAERQTAGRGRGANLWWAAPGALTFSLLLEPALWGVTPEKWPQLSLCTGLAICQALEPLLPHSRPQLKWPNDVYADGRKICGVLLETAPEAPGRLVVGIGLNVNNSIAAAPEAIRKSAAALCDLTGAPLDPTDILVRLLLQYERLLQALAGRDPELAAGWRDYCALRGRMVTLTDVAAETTGLCEGIDDDGALRILTGYGPQRFFAGTVRTVDERRAASDTDVG